MRTKFVGKVKPESVYSYSSPRTHNLSLIKTDYIYLGATLRYYAASGSGTSAVERCSSKTSSGASLYRHVDCHDVG